MFEFENCRKRESSFLPFPAFYMLEVKKVFLFVCFFLPAVWYEVSQSISCKSFAYMFQKDLFKTIQHV